MARRSWRKRRHLYFTDLPCWYCGTTGDGAAAFIVGCLECRQDCISMLYSEMYRAIVVTLVESFRVPVGSLALVASAEMSRDGRRNMPAISSGV